MAGRAAKRRSAAAPLRAAQASTYTRTRDRAVRPLQPRSCG